MSKIDLNKTFYLIAQYWLGDLEGFIKIGDDKEEIMKVFRDKYTWKENTFGITEQSHELLEVNAKVIATDQDIIRPVKIDGVEIQTSLSAVEMADAAIKVKEFERRDEEIINYLDNQISELHSEMVELSLGMCNTRYQEGKLDAYNDILSKIKRGYK